MSTTRTVTYSMSGLQLPGPLAPSFAFSESTSTITITLPALSKWQMPYHWHLSEAECELMQFLPGGDVEFFRSLGPYRNSSESGNAGLTWQLRPRERCYWQINTHRPQRPGDPDLQTIVRSQAAEELWRNVVSATIDRDLWPELVSTPPALRLVLRLSRLVPFVGLFMWEMLVAWALSVQLRMIHRKHAFWVWGGFVPITWLWDGWPWPGTAPKWAQRAEWRSAEVVAKVKCGLAVVVGRYMLGMRDGYGEYYRARGNVPHLEEKQ